MNDRQEPIFDRSEAVAFQPTDGAEPLNRVPPVADAAAEATGAAPEQHQPRTTERNHVRAEAGRKGARRVHQLIQAGRLYEKEHGLKRGRQRLRQLIELGKLYEKEHGISPPPRKKGGRLSRMERDQLLTTLLQCLVRIAKPSFRSELLRLAESIQGKQKGQAA